MTVCNCMLTLCNCTLIPPQPTQLKRCHPHAASTPLPCVLCTTLFTVKVRSFLLYSQYNRLHAVSENRVLKYNNESIRYCVLCEPALLQALGVAVWRSAFVWSLAFRLFSSSLLLFAYLQRSILRLMQLNNGYCVEALILTKLRLCGTLKYEQQLCSSKEEITDLCILRVVA